MADEERELRVSDIPGLAEFLAEKRKEVLEETWTDFWSKQEGTYMDPDPKYDKDGRD